MSLILDALNRAEQERKAEQLKPDLHSSVITPEPAKRPIGRWIAEAVLVLIAVVGIVLYLQFGRLENQAEDQTETAATTNPQPTKAVEQSQPVARQPEPSTPLNRAQEPAHQQAATPPAPATAQSNQDQQQIASLYSQPAEEPDPPETITPETVLQEQVAQARPQTAPQPAAPAEQPEPLDKTFVLQQIPLLQELPRRFQNSVPSLDYSLHVYNEDGGGLVKINGDVKKAGALVNPGIRVIEILEDSVVLTYQGRQFRLLALNSWINLN